MRRIVFALIAVAFCPVVSSAQQPAPPPSAAAEAKTVKPLKLGTSERYLTVNDLERGYVLYVPKGYDAKKPTPVVLCFHGAITNGPITLFLTNLNKKAEEAGFIVVYPNGTSRNGVVFTWNSGGIPSAVEEAKRDDVKFTAMLLDDLASVANVDKKRVFATGLSNGGMMCHRLGVELSDRIAAIAPVAGTLALEKPTPKRPMPVMQFHGTADTFVPWNGMGQGPVRLPVKFRGVEETIRFWTTFNACADKPQEETLPDTADDGTTVTRFTYPGGKGDSEVILVKVTGGGHTWPGRDIRLAILGKTTKDISANNLMWEFFQKHPLP
ncbi:MAG: PHB depolymerase family esterase [Pirellulales bacterium]